MSSTTFEEFEAASQENRRLLRQEQLILDVTETLCEYITKAQITHSELATRLGKSKGHVSRLLAGDRNLTLRSIADLADALHCVAHFQLEPQKAKARKRYETQIIEPSQWCSRSRFIYSQPRVPQIPQFPGGEKAAAA